MATASMLCVQIGLAVSVGLIDRLGAEGAAWLRLVWAGLLFLVIGRPWRVRFTRSALAGRACSSASPRPWSRCSSWPPIARLPLGMASALEFLGPLGVAVARGRGERRFLWPLCAGVGVLLLTQPWTGEADPVGVAFALGAACCWAAYIVLTQKVGDEVAGLSAASRSRCRSPAWWPPLAVGPSVFGRMTPELLVIGIGLAVLLPIVPFSLELLALRRLNTAAFGTLMSLEPAFALLIGLVAPRPGPGRGWPCVGIAFVVAAGIGAERTGRPGASLAPGLADAGA